MAPKGAIALASRHNGRKPRSDSWRSWTDLAIVVKGLLLGAVCEQIFEMKRAFEVKDRAIYLTDGLVNLALLNYTDAPGRARRPRMAVTACIISASASPISKRPRQRSKRQHQPMPSISATRTATRAQMEGARKTDAVGSLSEKGWYGALDEAIQEKEPAPARSAAPACRSARRAAAPKEARRRAAGASP